MAGLDPKLQEALFQGLAEEFLRRLNGGRCEHCGRSGATHQELQALRQFLNDNGVTAVAAPGTPLGDVVKGLPFGQKPRLLEGRG